MALKALTAKHILFAELLITKMHSKQAAIQSGFSEKTAKQTGHRFKNDPLIKAYIKDKIGVDTIENDKPKKTIVDHVNNLKPKLNDKYKEIVAGAQDARLFREIDVSQDRLINELYVIGTFDPKILFDKKGNLLHIKDMPPEARHAISEIEIKTFTDKNGQTVSQHKVKMHSKLTAIDTVLKNTEKQKAKIKESTPEERQIRMKELIDKKAFYDSELESL